MRRRPRALQAYARGTPAATAESSATGYVEGKTHTLELRWAEGRSDTFPALAADLVRLRVDLIVSAAGPAAESAARRLGVRLQVIEVRRVEDLAPAFDAADVGRAQGVMSTQAPLFVHNNGPIARLALKHRLPSLSGEPGAAKAGALLFYGPNVFEGCARAARYVDRILKGAKPADLPVEQPTKIELVVNSTTAKALGLTVPQSILARAGRIVQ
jgi:ABC transporter substrate binding protein